MAIGDCTQLKLIQKALSATASDSAYANAGATYTTTVTSITVYNSAAVTRTVSVYLYGVAAGNKVMNIELIAGATEIITNLDYVLTAALAISLAQDTGTDVICAVMGLQEVTS